MGPLRLVRASCPRVLHQQPMTPREIWSTYSPPELPEAAKLRAAIERLKKMSPDEVFETSVRAGIHNPDGTLTPQYRAG